MGPACAASRVDYGVGSPGAEPGDDPLTQCWLRGVKHVEGCSPEKACLRFRTEALERRLPATDLIDSWGQNHLWFYEVETSESKSGVGCVMKLQLSCYLPKKSPLPEERREATVEFINSFARGDISVSRSSLSCSSSLI